MEKISLVIPCYNEEKNIVYFHEETNKIFEKEKVKIEYVFINDGEKIPKKI